MSGEAEPGLSAQEKMSKDKQAKDSEPVSGQEKTSKDKQPKDRSEKKSDKKKGDPKASKLGKELMKMAATRQSPQKKAKTKEELEEERKLTREKMTELRKRSKAIDNNKMFMTREQVIELLPELCDEQDYKFRITEVRNILLVGRSRSGKTTVIRTLRGVENAIKPLTIFSETKNVNFRSFSLQGQSELDYTFNIVDTPGLFEVKRQGQKTRTDEEILDMISDCLKNEITKVHAIILFCSLTAGVDNTDVIAMKKLIECFGTDTNMAICVTRAENMNSEDRNKITTELEEHSEMGELLTKVNQNIFFMGAVDPDRITDPETLKKYVTKVVQDRANFLDFLFLCNLETRIEDLKFVVDKRDEVKRRIQDRHRLVTGLLHRELDDEQSQLLVKNIGLEVQGLKHMCPLFDPDCLELYAKLSKDMDQLCAKMDGLKENKEK